MTDKYQELIKSGYLTDSGSVKVQLVDEQAKALAEEFNQCSPALSTTQARSFFKNVYRIYDLLTKKKKISTDEAIVELMMLKSRISNKVSKKSVPIEFQRFFDLNMSCIKTEADITAFRLHYEAICNYLKDTKPQGKRDSSKPRNDRNPGQNSNHYTHR